MHVVDAQLGLVLDELLHDDGFSVAWTGGRDAPLDDHGEHHAKPTRRGLHEMPVGGLDDQLPAPENGMGARRVGGYHRLRHRHPVALGEQQFGEQKPGRCGLIAAPEIAVERSATACQESMRNMSYAGAPVPSIAGPTLPRWRDRGMRFKAEHSPLAAQGP